QTEYTLGSVNFRRSYSSQLLAAVHWRFIRFWRRDDLRCSLIIIRSIELPRDAGEAFAMQSKLAAEVKIVPGNTAPRYVAAADVSYTDNSRAYAAVVVMDSRDLSLVEQVTWTGVPSYPYLPGLFALREADCLLEAFKVLQTMPDVILIDGHGTAHPRQF